MTLPLRQQSSDQSSVKNQGNTPLTVGLRQVDTNLLCYYSPDPSRIGLQVCELNKYLSENLIVIDALLLCRYLAAIVRLV